MIIFFSKPTAMDCSITPTITMQKKCKLSIHSRPLSQKRVKPRPMTYETDSILFLISLSFSSSSSPSRPKEEGGSGMEGERERFPVTHF